MEPMAGLGYDIDRPEKTPVEAWDEHVTAFERKAAKAAKAHWPGDRTRARAVCHLPRD